MDHQDATVRTMGIDALFSTGECIRALSPSRCNSASTDCYKNKRFNGNLNPERAATLALYHEVSETKLQDINTNTKYHNPEFTKAFKTLENIAEKECLATLPEDLRDEMESLIVQSKVDPEYKAIVKAADLLQAYVKTKMSFVSITMNFVM